MFGTAKTPHHGPNQLP